MKLMLEAWEIIMIYHQNFNLLYKLRQERFSYFTLNDTQGIYLDPNKGILFVQSSNDPLQKGSILVCSFSEFYFQYEFGDKLFIDYIDRKLRGIVIKDRILPQDITD
jgi:hypothetical protein